MRAHAIQTPVERFILLCAFLAAIAVTALATPPGSTEAVAPPATKKIEVSPSGFQPSRTPPA